MTKQERLEQDAVRLQQMRDFENETIDQLLLPKGMRAEDVLICGIDEAGRGPLAGPVAAGAVILPKDHNIPFINDSKKLSEKKREELYAQICEEAAAWSVVMVEPERIDEINILQATYEAMRMAVKQLKETPGAIAADAVHIPDLSIPQVSVVKGDARCISIAAASILAKVTRDRLMREYDLEYPAYGFSRNKGYGTKEHTDAIRRIGPCRIHRRTFISHFLSNKI